MIDRPKALIAGIAVTLAVIVVLSIGFVAGRSSGNDENSTVAPPREGDGLPAGPTSLDDGVPVGFAQSEQGAVGAAVAWLPLLLSTPADEIPDSIEEVLAAGVDAPFGEDGIESTRRVQFVPLGAKISMGSDTEATVTIFGPALNGELEQDLTGEFLAVPVDLTWDSEAGDWRISRIQETDIVVEAPFSSDDLSGFYVVRPYGAAVGGALIEEVPGE